MSPSIPSHFKIRHARREDAPRLVELILAMAEESEGRMLDRAVLQAGVESVFTNPGLGTYWIAENTGHPDSAAQAEIIASTLITVEWSDWNNAPYWWIQSLYIQPEHRGQGLFEQLLATIETEAQTQDVCEIRLYVEKNNARAIRVYQKTGFDAEHYLCMTKPLV